jgi:pimeloyl-ACP methyl ester carboxylesterase
MVSETIAEMAQSLRMSGFFMLAYIRYAKWLRRECNETTIGRVGVGDASIYYRSYGRGEPLLMLHGGFASGETWAGQIPALAQRYKVVAMDSRGHGHSTLGTKPFTFSQLAEDAAGVIAELELGPVHLVGWSDGGCTSLAMALERPELVRSMVLLGTPFSTDNYPEEAKKLTENILRPYSFTMLGIRALRRLTTPEPRRGAEFLEKMSEMWTQLPTYTVDDLRDIKAPTLVIGCDRDEFLSPAGDPLWVFRETAEAIPNARLEVIEGGTHIVSLERPDEVNRLILEFLQDLPS